MGDWSGIGFGGRNEEGGANAADSGGTPVTAGVADVKGVYAQLIASTLFDSHVLTISAEQVGANVRDNLLDIAVGAAASEQDIVSNLLFSGRIPTDTVVIPLYVAAGSRVSARIQSTQVSEVLDVAVHLFGKTLMNSSPLHRETTYGAATGDTGGTGVDPGGVANTKGAYAQLTASSTNNCRELLLAFGSRSNSGAVDSSFLVDIAVGAATSEQIIIADIMLRQGANRDEILPHFFGSVPVNIPAGTRIAARAQSDIIDATDRLIDVVAYGMD